MSTIKSQDVLVALKLLCIGDEEWSFSRLGKSLELSVGAAHNAVAHLRETGLVFDKKGEAVVARRKLFDFLVHGVPVMLPPKRGGIGRGMPTAFHASPLLAELPKLFEPTSSNNIVAIVWPTPNGKAQGETLEPIYETVPRAAATDVELYAYLCLVDGVRIGKSRAKKIAIEMLEAKMLTDKSAVPEAVK